MASALRHDLHGCSRKIGSLGQILARRLSNDDDSQELLELIQVNARRSGAIAEVLAVLVDMRAPEPGARTDAPQVVRESLSLREGWTIAPASTEQAAHGPLHVAGPRSLVERALAPLLDNAEKYGREPRSCASFRDGECVRIDVRSGGDVLTRDYLDHILRPMQRGHGADEAAAGMGLTLAQHATQLLAGTLDLNPDPDGGLICQLRLPTA